MPTATCLKNRLDELEQQRLQLLKPPPASALTCPTKLNNSMTCAYHLTQIDEVYLDIEKQLGSDEMTVTDFTA